MNEFSHQGWAYRVRSSAIRRGLGVEPLLLRTERSQKRWLRHLGRMPPGHLPGEALRAHPSSRRPPEDPGLCPLAGLGKPRDLDKVTGGREVWAAPAT